MTHIFFRFFYILVLSQIVLIAETINLDQAFTKAQKTAKTPLVYLHKNGCPYCEKLEEFTLDDEDVDNYIKEHYNFIVINVSNDEDTVIYHGDSFKPRDFAIWIGYNMYPSTLFFSKEGELEHASVGYIEELEFLLVLKYIKTKAYKTMNIEQFKAKIGFEEEDTMVIDKRKKL